MALQALRKARRAEGGQSSRIFDNRQGDLQSVGKEKGKRGLFPAWLNAAAQPGNQVNELQSVIFQTITLQSFYPIQSNFSLICQFLSRILHRYGEE